jgi:hypothetical protein
MPTMGAKTTDDIEVRQIVNEVIDSIERHNEESRNFKTEFCNLTRKENVTIRQRSMTFKEMGSDTTVPDMQHVDERVLSLSEAKRYGVRQAISSAAYEKGIASDDIVEASREAMDADYRFVTQVVLKAMLNDGGFWDAAMTKAPPSWKMQEFSNSHDHYLYDDAGGVPALAHFTELKRHIQHHGYGFTSGSNQRQTAIVVLINGDAAQEIEDTADWIDNTNDRIPGPVMDTLQRLGMTSRFMAAGCVVVVDDWIPENYMLAFDPLQKLCHWRLTDNPTADDLIVHTTPPDVQYVSVEDFVRWASVRVTLRGAGACYYLDDSSWTDPTGWEI